jgi:hypothetical protein
MDDATNEHYDMFFVDEESTVSSFRGVKTVIESRGLVRFTVIGAAITGTPRKQVVKLTNKIRPGLEER